jgi:hypothetical protein
MENTGPWKAEPILVSGASAYRDGEFLYQDFLYDDAGADGSPATPGPGTYTYPTDAAYARNAADIVEVRLKPLAHGTAVRLTYNTMLKPELVAATLILGDSAGTRPLPNGANVQAPAQIFVTVHGSDARIVDAATGQAISSSEAVVSLDSRRRQVHLCVPYTAFDPRGLRAVRVALGVGLWDVANDQYLLPGATATATQPGGAGTLVDPPAFFNVAFRYDEPLNDFANQPNRRQAAVLATGDMSPFHAIVDFTALRAHVDDDMPGQAGGVPQTGYMNRILQSHFEQAQGRGTATTLQPDRCPAEGCPAPSFAGNLQPYEIYVPSMPVPASGYGLVVHPHAAGGNQNSQLQLQSMWQPQIGERELPYIAYTPNARGTAYWYFGQAAAEVFEIWADIAHRYKLDPSLTQISGLSMGGYGTWKLGGQFPDLFAAAPTIIPCPSAGTGWQQANVVPPLSQGGAASMTRLLAPSFRHVPQYMWTGTLDTTCAHWAQIQYADALDALGYRYEFYEFPVGHALPIGNAFGPMVSWMDFRRVVKDPAHITYVLNGMMSEPDLGLNADHVYWLSGLTLRDTDASPPIGTIDVFSHGFGMADAPANPTQFESGQMQGPSGPVPYMLQSRDWGTATTIPVRNQLDIVAQNVSAVTIHPNRAKVNCNATLNVQSDGPIVVTLAGCK